MGGFNLQSLMSQAKQQYENLQKKMQETVVEATAGGGTVHVKMDGRKQLLSLKINPEAVQAGDIEMLQDLITAAINEAGRQVDQAMQSSVGGMLGGMGIPGMYELIARNVPRGTPSVESDMKRRKFSSASRNGPAFVAFGRDFNNESENLCRNLPSR